MANLAEMIIMLQSKSKEFNKQKRKRG